MAANANFPMHKLLLALFAGLAAVLSRAAADAPVVFPLPQEMSLSNEALVLDASTRIVLPLDASEQDIFLARELSAELSDRFGQGVPSQRVADVPSTGRVIVIGTRANPLVRASLVALGLVDAPAPAAEGYVLHVNARVALVAGSDEAGAFYGLQSLRQLVVRQANGVALRGATLRDWPHKPFRGVRLYLPGRDNIPFFKRFLRDFMALYKFNQLILEVNAAMRFDRHPELNAGWIEFGRDLIGTRRDRPDGPRGENTDSTHHDVADGGVLEKAELAEIVAWARRYHIEVIPEIPSLTHSYYLLTRHREIAEMRDAEWPDAYCPSNPKSYELLFDVLDEYLEVIQPRMVHIGHDEWRVRLGACPLCRQRDARDLFAEDVRKIHARLTEKGVGVMMWGDHLIEDLRGKNGVYAMTAPGGFKYQRPGGLTAEQVKAGIPKDIVIANWFWQDGLAGQGEVNDVALQQWGFRQVMGNFEPKIQNWSRRSASPSILGGAPSSWAATTEFNFGKDLMYQFLGCENLLWSTRWPDEQQLTADVQALLPDVRRRLSGRAPASALGDPVRAVPLAADGGVMRTALGATSAPIAIGQDASSLTFVHACEARAGKTMSYRMIHDFDDTADLLGHYEVLYDDGFVATIPVRYGVNVLEQAWSPATRPGQYCYLGDPVEIGPGRTFFAYEWPNPRLGKVIKSVVFKGSSGFKSATGRALGQNALLLQSLSIVPPKIAKPGAKLNTEDPE